ncbi:hypothetical protein STEG23_017308, partial [Scotinomys teguina]
MNNLHAEDCQMQMRSLDGEDGQIHLLEHTIINYSWAIALGKELRQWGFLGSYRTTMTHPNCFFKVRIQILSDSKTKTNSNPIPLMIYPTKHIALLEKKPLQIGFWKKGGNVKSEMLQQPGRKAEGRSIWDVVFLRLRVGDGCQGLAHT